MKSLTFVLLAALPLAAGPDDSFLIRGVTVHTVSGQDIPNGSILVQDGKIMGVGAKLSPPKGIRIIEGKSLHVYPGIIDSASEVGMIEIDSVKETTDLAELGDFNPQLRTVVAVNPSSEHIPVTRANGITAMMNLPRGGMISGQGSLMHLDGWTWEEMAILRSGAMHINFPVLNAPPSQFGDSRGVPFAEARKEYEARVRALHEFFEQCRRYQKAKSAAMPGFQTDLKYEAMIPVLERTLPALVTAVRERAVHDAVEFAGQERIRIILADVREPGKMLPELKAKGIPVVLGKTLELPLNDDDPYDAPASLPAQFYKAGVKFAFASFSASFSRNLPYQAANAVAFGLPYSEALKAVTLNAAEIWGVSDRMGSIDEGKWADLMITDGDPLETKTQIKQLFIKGKPVDLENRHHMLYEKYINRP
ncbi:MAG: amidohydrolase family protein [Bryobacteraceae bacterium]